MNKPLKKGARILVSTAIKPRTGESYLDVYGDTIVRAVVTLAPQPHRTTARLRFACEVPIDGRTVSLAVDDEGVTWARGWDRESKRAFRAMLKLKAA
ncbi:MAG: hypothetical protein A2Y38_23525 [Spirochaetes bacterium GWB1_59_5]|nr:MAG: hypothetical protein A2Y38_23525 [Spirochaetes bacterium GWB1_59_5]